MQLTYLNDPPAQPMRLDQVLLLGRLCGGRDFILRLGAGREALAVEAARHWRDRGKRVLLVSKSAVSMGALLQTAFRRGARRELQGATPLAVTNWDSLWRAGCAGDLPRGQFDVLLLVSGTAVGVMIGG